MDDNAVIKNLTVSKVKEIMVSTAIKDEYVTTGTNASHFGNGKINALAGINAILGNNTLSLTDDIPHITNGNNSSFTTKVYNLQGQQVSNINTRGIYIVNGNKYIK